MSQRDNPDLLNSWKEIATFLDRGVRTVERWERTAGLPVHRIADGEHRPVFAFKHEIQHWLEGFRAKTSTADQGEIQKHDVEKARRLKAELRSLLAKQKELANALRRTQGEFQQVKARIENGMKRRGF